MQYPQPDGCACRTCRVFNNSANFKRSLFACLRAATYIYLHLYTHVMLLVHAVCTDSPPQPGNGSLNCPSPALPGSVCNATCDIGYWGAPTATCQPNGTYSHVTGACELIGALYTHGSDEDLALDQSNMSVASTLDCDTHNQMAALVGT
jgi:hypothetical protein